MVTSSSSFPSSPSSSSTSSTSATDPTRSSSDDALGGSSLASEGSMSSTSASAMPSSASSLKPDLMDRVVRGAHETVDKLADQAKPQLQRLQEGADSASETLHARVDQAREMSDQWAESLRTTVRENPLAAVGTALAIGLIIARLSR